MKINLLTKTKLMRIALAALMLPVWAMAANTLDDLSFSSGSGGQVEVVLTLGESASEPQVFATDNPPRIAIDLLDTTNRLKSRHINIGVGSTKRASVVQAGGRTRVVLELFRTTAFDYRVDGRTVVVSLANDIKHATAAGASASVANIKNIDFRRGINGEGKIIVSFDSPGANVDLQQSAGAIQIQIYNAALPESLYRRLDVMDFATPVDLIDASSKGENVVLTVTTHGETEHLAYQTGTDFVVEIKEPEEEIDELKAFEEKEYVGDNVTFNFQDIPVRTLLQLVADFSELNIVVSDSVDGDVSLRLVNIPWDQVLDIVLESKGLDKRRNGDVIWVAPAQEISDRERQQLQSLQDKQKLEPLRTDFIQINYAKAIDLATLIKTSSAESAEEGSQSLLSERGSVTVDERTNTLLVQDTAENIANIRDLVSRLDHPVRQVQIETRIVVATDDFRKELGARFGVTGTRADNNGNLVSTSGRLTALDRMTNTAIRNRVNNAGAANGFPNTGLPNIDTSTGLGEPLIGAPLLERLNVNLPVSAPAGAFSWSILTADYLLDLEISAMESEGRGEVVSSPRVITANQQKAVIKQGTQIPFLQASSSGATVTQFKDVVLELSVQPLITPDNRVILDLDVKQDSLAGFFGPTSTPIIDTRGVKTQVLVNNGETVVLGGIFERTFQQDKTKVPILGDLPGVGVLFRNTIYRDEKAELLIFVTPSIVDYSLGFE